jgi:hypothetical protein
VSSDEAVRRLPSRCHGCQIISNVAAKTALKEVLCSSVELSNGIPDTHNRKFEV